MQLTGFNYGVMTTDWAVHGGPLKEVSDELHKFEKLNNCKAVLMDLIPAADRKDPSYHPEGGGGNIQFDPEIYKIVLDETVKRAKIDIFFYTLAVGAIKDGDTLKGVFIESRQGKNAILGKVIIDATGIADIAFKSGLPYVDGGVPKGFPKAGRYHAFDAAFVELKYLSMSLNNLFIGLH